tara:strand:- start:216 stop:443 length:228 start_codon:yes stop_codon:yes gene_type:complete
MEYIVASLSALILSTGYTQFTKSKQKKTIAELQSRIEQVEIYAATIDKEALKKMVITVQPLAGAVKQLQDAVGIQ